MTQEWLADLDEENRTMMNEWFTRLNDEQIKGVDDMVKAAFNTTLTFRQYFAQTSSFRNTITRIFLAKRRAAKLAETDAPAAATQLHQDLMQIANGLPGKGVIWEWSKKNS